MRRRTLLASVGSTIAAGFAGCLGGAGGQPSPSDSPTSSDTPAGTEPPTAGTSPGDGDTSTPGDTASPPGTRPTGTPSTPATLSADFEVLGSECGTGDDAASVTFGSETILIEGTIRGSDSCDTADLGDIVSQDGLLTVPVHTERPEGTPACAQCITDIDYEVEINPAGPLPDTVEVRHDGQVIATRER